MTSLRDLRLGEAFQAVRIAARFRKPQFIAFEQFHKVISFLENDLPKMPVERIAEQLIELGHSVPAVPVDLIFELATGVGKTRLMGAIIAYLAKSGQTRNCLVLASRMAILNKLERETDPTSSKYLFIDRTLVGDPALCFRSNIEGFVPDPDRLNVFVLSPQTVTGEERRFARRTDFGPSLKDYLRAQSDLIVLSDESHHIPGGGAGENPGAWRHAITGLNPKLHLGFSATPAKYEGSNVLYSYDLAECLREGLYTKSVKVWVERRPAEISNDDAWDHTTVDFALQRLDRKRDAIRRARAEGVVFPEIEPVLLLAARDTDHADELEDWLVNAKGLPKEQILVAHSKKGKQEAEIERLVSLDEPGNKIRIVINVFQLSEGWDVNSVYVIAPLRSMATFGNAIQTMGRGLRLPAGRRTGHAELDQLDVLCFGKENFETIVNEATEKFGEGAEGAAAISVASPTTEEGDLFNPKTVRIKAIRSVKFEIPAVNRVIAEPDLNFSTFSSIDISAHVSSFELISQDRDSSEETLRHSFDAVVRIATAKVLNEVRYLNPVRHQSAVEKLIKKLLEGLGAKPGTDIATDPVKVAVAIVGEIGKRYKKQVAKFKVEGSAQVVEVADFDWSVPQELDAFPKAADVEKWQ